MLLLRHRQLGLKIFFVPSKKNGGLQSDRPVAAVFMFGTTVALTGGVEGARISMGWRAGDGCGDVTWAERQKAVAGTPPVTEGLVAGG